MYPLTKWIVSQARELSTEEVTEVGLVLVNLWSAYTRT
jgi:hypothetical protein